MQERRKNVRVRPSADYDIGLALLRPPVNIARSVLDVAVGGVGVVVDEVFAGAEIGSRLKISVTLPEQEPFVTQANVRYCAPASGGRSGLHFDQLTAEQQAAFSRAVSELLERGYSV